MLTTRCSCLLWNHSVATLRVTPHCVYTQTALQRPYATPITVHAAACKSLRLVFASESQTLVLIEVTPPVLHQLMWKEQPLLPPSGSSSGDASRIDAHRLLNSIFGPTYPPAQHPSYPEERTTSYPGIVFGYPGKPSQAATPKACKDMPHPISRVIVSSHDPAPSGGRDFPDVALLSKDSIKKHPGVTTGDVECVDITVSLSMFPMHTWPTESYLD